MLKLPEALRLIYITIILSMLMTGVGQFALASLGKYLFLPLFILVEVYSCVSAWRKAKHAHYSNKNLNWQASFELSAALVTIAAITLHLLGGNLIGLALFCSVLCLRAFKNLLELGFSLAALKKPVNEEERKASLLLIREYAIKLLALSTVALAAVLVLILGQLTFAYLSVVGTALACGYLLHAEQCRKPRGEDRDDNQPDSPAEAQEPTTPLASPSSGYSSDDPYRFKKIDAAYADPNSEIFRESHGDYGYRFDQSLTISHKPKNDEIKRKQPATKKIAPPHTAHYTSNASLPTNSFNINFFARTRQAKQTRAPHLTITHPSLKQGINLGRGEKLK